MKKKNIVWILLVILALVGGIVFGLLYNPNKKDDDELSSEFVYQIEKSQVKSIKIESNDLDIVFSQEADGWLVNGIEDISQAKVDTTVDDIIEIASTQKVDMAKDECGLDNPSITIYVKSEDKEDVIKIGDYSAGLDKYFITVNDGEIYTWYARRVEDITKPPEYYTEYDRLLLSAENIWSVEINNRDGRSFLLDSYEENEVLTSTWKVVGAYSQDMPALDDNVMTMVLQPLANLSITTPTDAVNNISAKSTITVVSKKNGEEIKDIIKLGDRIDDRILVELNGKNYFADAGQFDFVNVDVFALTAKSIITVPIKRLSRIGLNVNENVYDITVSNAQNNLTFTLNGNAVDAEKIKSAYQVLALLTADAEYNNEPTKNTVMELELDDTRITISEVDEYHLACAINGKTDFLIKRSDFDSIINKACEILN